MTTIKTIIIAGIRGDIGKAFAYTLKDLGSLHGISRRKEKIPEIRYNHLCCDLLDAEQVQSTFENIHLTENLLYMHLPGAFKFQDDKHPIRDANQDGIDDEVFATNVETFRNVEPHLIRHLENPKARLKVVAMGSTSDLYACPYWHSYTYAKNTLRQELRKLYGNPLTYGRVSTLFINISTTDGEQLTQERPFIAKNYVLTANKIIAQARSHILSNRNDCLEMNILEPNPHFDDYVDREKIKERWYQDMGYNTPNLTKAVPSHINNPA